MSKRLKQKLLIKKISRITDEKILDALSRPILSSFKEGIEQDDLQVD